MAAVVYLLRSYNIIIYTLRIAVIYYAAAAVPHSHNREPPSLYHQHGVAYTRLFIYLCVLQLDTQYVIIFCKRTYTCVYVYVIEYIRGDWPINSDHDHWITTSGFHYDRTRRLDTYIVLYIIYTLYLCTYVMCLGMILFCVMYTYTVYTNA